MASVEQDIEKAVEELARAAASQFEYDLAYVTSCVETGYQEKDISYPCIVIACAPFIPDTPRSPLGYCQLVVTCMTDQNADKFGMILNQICAIAFPQVTAAKVGPMVYSPWLLCGVNDTGPSEVSVDEDASLNVRAREFQMALFDTSGQAATTTTTGG